MYEILAISFYFSFLFVYALRRQKKSLTQQDFVIGGRSLNKWTTALAAHASDMSNWLFMAYPGMIFARGGEHIWVAIGLILIMWINWKVVAPKIRVDTEKTKSVTLCGFFESKLEGNWEMGRIMTSAILFIFYTVYVAAILSGIAVLLESLFLISYTAGLLIGIGLVLPFLLIGGYSTLAQVDLFQGLFLLGVILFVPIFVLYSQGGVGLFVEAVGRHGKSFSLFGRETSVWSHLLLMLGWGLGYFGQPHILTKFMGIKNPKDLSFSKNIGMSWQFLTLFAATLVGFVGIAVFQSLGDQERVFIELVRRYFPPFVSGIFLCAIIAAIINAMSSMLLVLSTTIVEDFYKRFSKQEVSEKKQLTLTRISCMISGLLALIIALPKFASINVLVQYAWSGLGASFGPLLIALLYYDRVTKLGAWVGMAVGGLTVCFWPLVHTETPALVVAFPLSLITILISSRVKERSLI